MRGVQALAQSGTEILAGNQANDAVATVFRTQAHKLLYQPGGLIGAVRPAG